MMRSGSRGVERTLGPCQGQIVPRNEGDKPSVRESDGGLPMTIIESFLLREKVHTWGSDASLMSMSAKVGRAVILCITLLAIVFPTGLWAGTSRQSKNSLEQLLLGKDVKSLTQLPATKEGVDIYIIPPEGREWDQRGLNLNHLTKWLKERGVGVESNEVVTITDLKIGGDMIEVHLAGGGMGRRGSKHAQKQDPGFQRAGGSRINFRYKRSITEADLQPDAFLDFMGRLLDVREIREEAARRDLPPEVRNVVESKSVTEGMTYQVVLLSWGEPEQKKISDSDEDRLAETWYYMRDGHRVVVDFVDGKVMKIQWF